MEKASDKKTLFDYFIEILGWLQIVASPLVLSFLLGGFVYFSKPSTSRLIIASLIVIIGLVIGILWATKVWRKKGTNQYLSAIRSSPDFDKFAEPKE